MHSDYLAEYSMEMGGKKNNFTVDKPDKQYFSQLIKTESNSGKSHG